MAKGRDSKCKLKKVFVVALFMLRYPWDQQGTLGCKSLMLKIVVAGFNRVCFGVARPFFISLWLSGFLFFHEAPEVFQH